MGLVRILFLSDTHLGFDMPFRPRVKRRRRGPDFFANFERALEPARQGDVDCVVHGGDVLYRSKVPPELVEMAFEPLKRLADTGVPVYVVPGNHERSAIPYTLLAQHPRIFLFDRPKTHTLEVNGFRLALAGFPSVRNGVRGSFRNLLEKTGWREEKANATLLLIHQAVEGATVGPSDYVFRYDDDTIRASDIPARLAAVLSGHIHRHQVLTRSLDGNKLSAPVFYPGSIERTSFAEKNETKGYLTLELETDARELGKLVRWQFCPLPARPMVSLELDASPMTARDLEYSLKDLLWKLPADAVVRVKIAGHLSADCLAVLTAASLRSLAPSTMNVSIKPAEREPAFQTLNP